MSARVWMLAKQEGILGPVRDLRRGGAYTCNCHGSRVFSKPMFNLR
jgi:hypothetical protein